MTNTSTTDKARLSLYIDKGDLAAFKDTINVKQDRSANAVACKLIREYTKWHERNKNAVAYEWTVDSTDSTITYGRQEA